MLTITLWLLVVLGQETRYGGRAPEVLEQFATVEECQRVARAIRDTTKGVGSTPSPMLCVQAEVVRP